MPRLDHVVRIQREIYSLRIANQLSATYQYMCMNDTIEGRGALNLPRYTVMCCTMANSGGA